MLCGHPLGVCHGLRTTPLFAVETPSATGSAGPLGPFGSIARSGVVCSLQSGLAGEPSLTRPSLRTTALWAHTELVRAAHSSVSLLPPKSRGPPNGEKYSWLSLVQSATTCLSLWREYHSTIQNTGPLETSFWWPVPGFHGL